MMRLILAMLVLSLMLVGCEEPVEERMSIEQAMEMAKDSECTYKSSLKSTYRYNENSKTWWIDVEMNEGLRNEYCNPACVVFENKVELNPRCGTLLEEEIEEES